MFYHAPGQSGFSRTIGVLAEHLYVSRAPQAICTEPVGSGGGRPVTQGIQELSAGHCQPTLPLRSSSWGLCPQPLVRHIGQGEGCTSAPYSPGENTSTFHGFSNFISTWLFIDNLEVKLTCATILFAFHHTASVASTPLFKKVSFWGCDSTGIRC